MREFLPLWLTLVCVGLFMVYAMTVMAIGPS